MGGESAGKREKRFDVAFCPSCRVPNALNCDKPYDIVRHTPTAEFSTVAAADDDECEMIWYGMVW